MRSNNSKFMDSSPYKAAKLKQHMRPRSKSPNRSFSNTSRSQNESHNTTIHSEYLWNALDELEMFPPLCMQMLKHEQRNIIEFKKSITREKNKIVTEIESLSVQINHIIEDYKLSLLAVMDRIYQQYITKYSDLKSQIMSMNRMKQEIQAEYTTKERAITRMQNNISNNHTIKTMQANQIQLKRYHILNYIAEMQKEKFTPLQDIAQYLFVLTQYQNGFFQYEDFRNYTKDIKMNFRVNFKKILDQIYGYIRDPDNIVFKQQGRNQRNYPPAYNSSNQRDTPTLNQEYPPPLQPQSYISSHPQRNYSTIRRQTQQAPLNYYSQINSEVRETYREPEINISRVPNMSQQLGSDQKPSKSRSQPYILYENDSQIQQMRTENSHQNLKSRMPPLSFNRDAVSNEGQRNYSFLQEMPPAFSNDSNSRSQVIVSPYRVSSESVRISEQQPFSFKSKAMDVILCCLYIDPNLIAVGSKDGSLLFYDRNGNVVKAHQNVHKSPVCTLAVINDGQFLASGSDHPHPEIILWNLNSTNLELFCRFKEHKGAVTAIQCLQDGEHFISGSYDKRLCVYSLQQRKIKYTLPSNKSSVTALSLNSTGMKLISCCLQNNALNIWQIVRNTNMDGMGKVETIFLQQVVENNAIICSVVSSTTRPNLVYLGTKDGRLKVVDIERGESVKNLNCCNNALIQMLVIEQDEGLPVIICWPCKEKCFKIVDCQTGKVANINTRGQLDFSCGVGPKVTRTSDGSGFVVCSQSDDREVYWYKINRTL